MYFIKNTSRFYRRLVEKLPQPSFQRLYLSSNRESSRNLVSASLNSKEKNHELDINDLPLTVPLPGLSKVSYAVNHDIQPFDTKLTLLKTGLKVASEPHFGQYCTIGVAINAGSRYAGRFPVGVPHFVEKLAFSKTSSFSTKEEMFSLLERRGALIDCQSTKDTFIFASSCHIDGVKDILTIISDAIMRPVITAESLKDARMIINYENEDMNSKPDCEPLLNDWIHMAAYDINTLGLSKYCPLDNLYAISESTIYSYLKQHHSPERMVVAAVGVDHDLLVSLSESLFDPSKAIWASDSSIMPSNIPLIDNSVAQYVGGEKLVEKDLSNMALGPSPFPNLAHLVIGFESCGFKDDDFVAFCVLQSLMGGGGSFSAGGPGKGMYTRLYVDVLNRYPWMYSATAFNLSYADSGIFYIQASSDPSKIADTASVIAEQFLLLLKGVVTKEELNRAKTQLKSQLMMNLEVRPVMFEDLSRQVLGHGLRRKPSEYVAKIDAVTSNDLLRISERMLSKRPSIVGYGDLKKFPDYKRFYEVFAKRSVSEMKKRSFFGFDSPNI